MDEVTHIAWSSGSPSEGSSPGLAIVLLLVLDVVLQSQSAGHLLVLLQQCIAIHRMIVPGSTLLAVKGK